MPAFSHTTRRGQRYWYLRDQHFFHREAAEWSKLSKKYPAVIQAVATRQGQWKRFQSKVRRHNWQSNYKMDKEWRSTIGKFYSQVRRTLQRDKVTGKVKYVDRTWIVKRDIHGKIVPPRISPWDWYDSIQRNLPPELKWDSPRSHRVHQPVVTVDVVRTHRWIADLERSVARELDPKRQAEFRKQIANLRHSLRSR